MWILKSNSNQNWNNSKCWCECKNTRQRHECEKKKCIQNLSSCTCENAKYLGSIIGDSVITCDEISEVTITIPTKTVLAKTVPIKTVPTNLFQQILNKRRYFVQKKICIFYSIFY